MAESNNTLKRPVARKLENWLEANWERIIREKVSRAVAAELATKELGFTVSLSNMTGAAKALERKWPVKACGKRGVGVKGAPRMLLSDGITLAEVVRKICNEVGASVPTELFSWLNGARNRQTVYEESLTTRNEKD